MPNTSMAPVIELAQELIARESLTPADAGCQDIIAERLEALGFSCERLDFGEVRNLWARHGSSNPVCAFAGHTDVVPPGNEAEWRYPPFSGTVADGALWGRGAADMKGGLAALICAAENFVRSHPKHLGSVALLITSAEEGASPDGTRRVVEELKQRGELPQWCVVGEPSSIRQVGDQVRHGRRGSITFRLRISGIQGHVAYPKAADNPIHRLTSILAELQRREWDAGDRDFPATSFQVAEIHAGVGAENVIPAEARAVFNFRYGMAQNAKTLREAVDKVVRAHAEEFEIEVHEAGEPFVTRRGKLLEAANSAIESCTGLTPAFSTSGGTSDGRYISPAGVELLEIGPTNSSIHAVNEHIGTDELPQLVDIYCGILERLLTTE